MKRITNYREINFSTQGSVTYILPKGVIVYVFVHPNSKLDIRVTNANYSEKDFTDKSYGSNYEKLEWYLPNMDRWINSSSI